MSFIAPILDDFNRADENPLAGIWYPSRTYGHGETCQLQTNQARQQTSGSNTCSSHTIKEYPSNQEVFATVTAIANSDDIEVNARIRDPNSGFQDFYQWVYFPPTTSWRIFRIENGSGAGIGPNPTSPVLAAGDSIGMRLIDSTIEGWHKSGSAGIWTKIVSHADTSPMVHAGFIGIGMNDADQAWRMDNFGGGAISAPSFARTIYGRGAA